jgi:hypothetical protein
VSTLDHKRALEEQASSLRIKLLTEALSQPQRNATELALAELESRVKFMALALRRADALAGELSPGDKLLRAIYGCNT